VIEMRRRFANGTPAGWPLALSGAIMLGTLAVALIGLVIDPRVISGAPAWLKPAKFGLSIAIYSITLLWLLTFVRGHARIVGLVGWVTAVGLVIEQSIIVAQVVRGTTSHFNDATPLDAALFNIMGSIIVVVWLMGLVTAVLLVRQRLPDAAFAWSLRFGIGIALIGMAVAFLMTSAYPGQRAAARERAQIGLPRTTGAHSVGVAAGDSGPGLPIVGWSTEGGDLRIPHFVGIHAINVLPFVAWALARTRLRARRQVAAIWTVSMGYLGLVGLLTWQALRGQSLVAPDGLTLLAATALGLVVAGGVLAVCAPRAALSPARAVAS
jgi:hypothetical protein